NGRKHKQTQTIRLVELVKVDLVAADQNFEVELQHLLEPEDNLAPEAEVLAEDVQQGQNDHFLLSKQGTRKIEARKPEQSQPYRIGVGTVLGITGKLVILA